MSESEETSEGAVFGRQKLLWCLPVLVCVPYAARFIILREQGWWLFADDAPLLDVALAVATAVVHFWVFSRFVGGLVSAPTLTVQRDALLVRTARATRALHWTDIRSWSLSNGGRLTFSLVSDRVRVDASALKDVGPLLASISQHIGQPKLELGPTSEVVRRIDAALVLGLVFLHAVRAREDAIVFALTFAGGWVIAALAFVFSRPSTVAAWAHSGALHSLIWLTLVARSGPPYPHADPTSAALTAIQAVALSVFAALALGVVPRAPREAAV